LDLRGGADPKRRESGQGVDRGVLEAIVATRKLYGALREGAARGGDDLVRAAPALAEPHVERLELFLVPPRAHAEHEAAVREVVQRLDLAGQRHGVVVGHDQEAGGEPNPARHAGRMGEAEERRHPDGAVEPGRDEEVLRHPQRIETEVFRLARERLHARGLLEGQIGPREGREVDAESHGSAPQYGSTRSPNSRIASMIFSLCRPPQFAWRRRTKNWLAQVAFSHP